MQGNGRKKKNKECVLIVDDDIFCRAAIASLFKKSGFNVSIASSGEEALLMIIKAKYKYDLIFVDLELPRMSGFKLVNELKTREHFDIPVFVVSGFQDKAMIIEMFNKDPKKFLSDIEKKLECGGSTCRSFRLPRQFTGK